MAQLVSEKKPRSLQIVITILVLGVLGAAGYLGYTLFFKPSATTVVPGQSLNTSVLDSNTLKLVKYDIASAPKVTSQDIGRDNPFVPF